MDGSRSEDASNAADQVGATPSAGAGGGTKRIFISYARRDFESARLIALELERLGYRVWWDVRLVPGGSYRKDLADYIDSSDKVLVIWSPSSITSTFVLDEASRALEQSKLVPISIGNAKPPLGFGQLHTPSIGKIEKNVDQIVAALEGQTPLPRRRKFAAGRWLRLLSIAAGLAVLCFGAAMFLLDRFAVDRLTNCIKYGCELDYATYRSRSMGLEFVYPQSHLALVTMHERERRLPFLNHKGDVELTIFRSQLPPDNDPMKASLEEQKRLTDTGNLITYVGPQIDPETKRFYVISGRTPDAKIFYFRRWFMLGDMVSAEYVFPPESKPIYDRVIVDMTIRSMKIYELK